MASKSKRRLRKFARARSLTHRSAGNVMRAESHKGREPDTLSKAEAAELAALEELAAAEEAEVARRKLVDLIHGINAPIRQITALRDAIRSPLDKIRSATSYLRNPLHDAFREQKALKSSLVGETAGLMGYKGSLGEAMQSVGHLGKPVGHLAEPMGNLADLVNKTSLPQTTFGKAALLAERLEQVGRPLWATSAFEKATTALDRLMSPEMTGITEPISVGPTFPEPRVLPPMRALSNEPPPPEVVDVEIEPRCKRCGAILKAELLMEKKPWSGPSKMKGEMHVEVCTECIRASGGDPERLPQPPKRPLD